MCRNVCCFICVFALAACVGLLDGLVVDDDDTRGWGKKSQVNPLSRSCCSSVVAVVDRQTRSKRILENLSEKA